MDAEIPRFGAFGGEYAIWMLDYDRCEEMSQNELGVNQAVNAFWRSDSYFPRPYRDGQTEEDRSLWYTFRTRFLNTSSKLLQERLHSQRDDGYMAKGKGIEKDPTFLANDFIKKVEEVGENKRYHSNWLAEFYASKGVQRRIV